MPIYHIVLFKLKPGVAEETLSSWAKLGKDMVGKVPGVIDWTAGPALEMTKFKAKEYDVGVVVILEKEEHIKSYAIHPAHEKVRDMKDTIGEDTLVLDMAF